jgi:hypothetical protein
MLGYILQHKLIDSLELQLGKHQDFRLGLWNGRNPYFIMIGMPSPCICSLSSVTHLGGGFPP